MRLGRRLSAGIAEDPPTPVPAEVGTPEPVVGTPESAEPAAAPAVGTRTPDPIGTGG